MMKRYLTEILYVENALSLIVSENEMITKDAYWHFGCSFFAKNQIGCVIGFVPFQEMRVAVMIMNKMKKLLL